MLPAVCSSSEAQWWKVTNYTYSSIVLSCNRVIDIIKYFCFIQHCVSTPLQIQNCKSVQHWGLRTFISLFKWESYLRVAILDMGVGWWTLHSVFSRVAECTVNNGKARRMDHPVVPAQISQTLECIFTWITVFFIYECMLVWIDI